MAARSGDFLRNKSRPQDMPIGADGLAARRTAS
jgi:hypothetical protein